MGRSTEAGKGIITNQSRKELEMKKQITALFVAVTMLFTILPATVFAETSEVTKTSNIMDLDVNLIKITDHGYSEMMGNDEVKIFYQEGTGLNTLGLIEFDVEGYVASYSKEENMYTSWYATSGEDYKLTVKIIDNPVNGKKAGENFGITFKVSYIDWDIYGDDVLYTAEITIPAEILPIEGKILDPPEVMEKVYVPHETKELDWENLYHSYYNKYEETTTSYKVCLNNGKVITKKSSQYIMPINVGEIIEGSTMPVDWYRVGQVRGYYPYDLRYKLENASKLGLWRGARFYDVGKDKIIRALNDNDRLYQLPLNAYCENYGHSYGNYILTKSATFGKNGVMTSTCSTCKAKKTKTIAALKAPTLSASAYTYNGKVKTPKVVIKDVSGKTISDSNYKITAPSGRKSVGSYKYKVTFNNNYSGTKTLTMKITPAGKSISKLAAGKEAFTVKWKKPSLAYRKQMTGYHIRYSTSSKMTKAKTVKVKSTTDTSKKVSKLKAKKKYYVQLRTYKTVNGKTYYSSWSKVKSVKTR